MKFDHLFQEETVSVEEINGEQVRVQVVQELPIDKLRPYHNHPFRLYDGERLREMLRSVNEVGILVPIVVRDAESDMYEILAGHNRVNAAKNVGLQTVPARILENISDELAALIVTESNLCQRSFGDMLYSERAVALKAHLDALRSQGKRNDLTDAVERLVIGGGAFGPKEQYTREQTLTTIIKLYEYATEKGGSIWGHGSWEVWKEYNSCGNGCEGCREWQIGDEPLKRTP